MRDERWRRVAVTVATASLLGLTAACGSTTSDASPPAADARPQPEQKQKQGGAESDTGMTDGCNAVHDLFAALDKGDQAGAQSLVDKGRSTFEKVSEAQAEQNKQLSSDAAAMASILEFGLPDAPIYQSSLAETYAVDCVARYAATPLPG